MWRKRGLIPNAVQVRILELAKEGKVVITAAQLIQGTDELVKTESH